MAGIEDILLQFIAINFWHDVHENNNNFDGIDDIDDLDNIGKKSQNMSPIMNHQNANIRVNPNETNFTYLSKKFKSFLGYK